MGQFLSKTPMFMLHVDGSHEVPPVMLLVSHQCLGCCLVQVENVECMPGDHIKFDFLGKDSIRYENEVVVHPKVYALIQKFCQHSANNKRKGPCTCTAI